MPAILPLGEDTEVLTPNGKVAIETLREGDLVIARNEDTGVSGTFPVTALMTRVALDTYWVELARTEGATTRLGVTSEHPMFVVGKGWLPAGEVEAGDKIRDASLGELLVLSSESDDTPPTRPQPRSRRCPHLLRRRTGGMGA